ncbi:MAG: C4-dicarboxylate ABC transporter, partial [Pseudomonadota bacterium]|nr:C4-dicarboxylate ABC transporter [Pseudomonadota bacterium]
DGTVDLGALALLILRLLLALVLLASALSRFDRARLALWEVGARLTLAAMLLAGDVLVYGGAAAAGIGLLAWHRVTTRSAATQPAGG